LVAREATTYSCKREVTQVHLTQVGTTEIESRPFALQFVDPICGAGSILGCEQQPFDIGTAEFDVFEGVDPLLDVGWYGEALAKKLLAFGDYFGFGAPGEMDIGSGRG